MERTSDTEEDFAYLRNQRNLIQGELSELFDCELHVHRNSAFLILGEECRMGRCFPEENTLSDAVLLTNHLIQKRIENREISVGAEEEIYVPEEVFMGILEECKENYGKGFSKTYREMTTRDFCKGVKDYMEELGFIQETEEQIKISAVVGKIAGQYPKDFMEEKKGDK